MPSLLRSITGGRLLEQVDTAFDWVVRHASG